MTIQFARVSGDARCEVRLSDAAMKTDGLVLIEKLTATPMVYCLNPGYYLIGCEGPAAVNVQYLDATEGNEYNVDHDLSALPGYYKVLKLEQVEESWTTVPESHAKADFDKNTPLTGEPQYPQDYTNETDDFTCDEAGYLAYLAKYPETMKCTSRDVTTDEFKLRLEYFIDSCEKIHDWNLKDRYMMEFTFYADWHPDEFEEITTTKQRYSGIKTPVPSVTVPYNNSNLRYLMPSLDPCDDVSYTVDNGVESRRLAEVTLREYICKPQNCSVTWAFAVTTSIEYAIEKMYFEEYDQIVKVPLSAQELIDCVGKEHGVSGKVCDGLPLAWAFDYVYENGIAMRGFYPHTNIEATECKVVPDEHKYHIAGYEKPQYYNKLGLFELVMRGPTAVTLGLDPEYFQFYRNDREEGPYFDTAFWRPSVYGVVVEYLQYAVEGEPEYAEWPFFAIEARLRACDAFVFRLPIRESEEDANVAGIAGFAIMPIVMELLPTPEPPTLGPTPTPTPEAWFPIYDPFILGDNSNYQDPSDNCFDHIISDTRVTELYLAVRDAYPTKALAHTRVIALSGMTVPSLQLWHESLSKQVKNEAPIDMYFYSDYKIVRYVDATMAIPLISLAQYTRPARIVFGDGSFKREGLNTVLQWMVDNRDKGYFVNLKYFQVTGHKAASYDLSNGMTTAEKEAYANGLSASITSNLATMCNDKVNFPVLEEFNFNNNAYNEFNNGFDEQLRDACDKKTTGVTIKARQVNVNYPTMCDDSQYADNYQYYDMADDADKAQCRFTWNWEMGNTNTNYAGHGPYPDMNTVECE